MEIKINTTINLPDNRTRDRIDEIVKHVQEVLVQIDLGIIKKDPESVKNAIMGNRHRCSYEYEEAYLSYIPYMFWFYHVDGHSWTTDELYDLWDWVW